MDKLPTLPWTLKSTHSRQLIKYSVVRARLYIWSGDAKEGQTTVSQGGMEGIGIQGTK